MVSYVVGGPKPENVQDASSDSAPESPKASVEESTTESASTLASQRAEGGTASTRPPQDQARLSIGAIQIQPIKPHYSSVTLSPLATHMCVPSNAIPTASLPTGKVPRGPQVAIVGGVHGVRSFLQAPAGRDATGARGARHSLAAGGQVLQGPASPQSLFSVQPERVLPEVEDDELDEDDGLPRRVAATRPLGSPTD